jgi:hypothetical protein
VRIILPMPFALLLAACAAGDASLPGALQQPSENVWKVEEKPDQITGLPAATAWIRTQSTTNSKTWENRPAALQLICFKGSPIIRLNFAIRVGANRNSTVGYRFDEKPGREVSATFMPDFKTIIIDEKAEVEQFLTELADSSRLLVRVTSLYAGRTTAQFVLTGAPAAIETAYGPCRAKGGKPQQRTTAVRPGNLRLGLQASL